MLAKFTNLAKKCTYTSRLLQLLINGNSIKINKSIISDNILILTTPGKTAAIAERSALSTDFPLRAERYQKMLPDGIIL